MPTHALILRGIGADSQITRHGITWTFSASATHGTFCNGDPWVVGPVTITAISPATTVVSGRTVNGTMVNPPALHYGDEQGYDSRLHGAIYMAQGPYNDTENIATQLPYVAATGSSVISCISNQDPGLGANSTPQLANVAVLTVLAAQPASGSFRPPYVGTDKTINFNESDLDYGVLSTLAPETGAPDIEDIAALFEHVWLDNSDNYYAESYHALNNCEDYSQYMAANVGIGALMLNCNYTNGQKRDLFVRMVQLGIDNYANVVAGCVWPGNGGHGSGRKFPILLAGAALADADMLAVGTDYPSTDGGAHPNNPETFGEDSQCFVVAETSTGVYNWGFGGYDAGDVGTAEWGISHTNDPADDDELINASGTIGNAYRYCCTANAWIGYCLAIREMGLMTEWAHASFFDYMDRYTGIVGPGPAAIFAYDEWSGEMWNTYR